MLIHSNIWEPTKHLSFNGSRWFVLFIDDHTCMTWVSLIKSKNKVSSLFLKFHKLIATQYQSHIQVLYTDNCGEFVNKDLKSSCKRT